MQTTLSRSAYADQLEAELRAAGCCDAADQCDHCRATTDEIRAARRDAIVHSLTLVRPRRHAR